MRNEQSLLLKIGNKANGSEITDMLIEAVSFKIVATWIMIHFTTENISNIGEA
jgi:hypothetical protein